MKTAIFVLFAIAVLLASLVPAALADSNESFDQAKALIAAKTPCSDLTQDQLEGIGDYYMEQMHPGEAHEQMDAMMGGEGSDSLRQMHISMGERFYCGVSTSAGGMMGNYPSTSDAFPGTMREWNGNAGTSAWSVVNNVLLTVLLVALIVLAVLGIIRLSKR